MVTKDHAQAIARKLKAVMVPGRKHDIRRGSRGDQGHDYVPGQIQVTRRQAIFLAQCPMSFDEWVLVMRQKGYIAT